MMRRRFLSFLLVIFFCMAVTAYADRHSFLSVAGENGEETGIYSDKTTLVLWYTDEALTDYLNREAVAYSELAEDVRVIPTLVSGLGFLEHVGEASALEEGAPDLYITTHDNLEKAALAGLAAEILRPEDVLRGDTWPNAALSSVTWHDKKIAYPFYGETTALLYNRTYLEEAARLAAAEAGEELPEDADLTERVEALLPETVGELLSFAGSYNAPDEVEAVIRFDVKDLFMDYFFAGDALNVGGDNGDNPEIVELYNDRVLTCMDIYQQLGQFFAIDPDLVTGDTIWQDFCEGRIVFTIATTDAVRKLAELESAGETRFSYGAAPLFDLTDNLPTRALSVTSCLVINGFSEHESEANRFAAWLTAEGANDLYARSGKVSIRNRAYYCEEKEIADLISAYLSVYNDSVPMPKMIETSNYWIRLETAFTDIWNGGDVNAEMKRVSEQLLSQIRGTPVVVDEIPNPERILLSEDLTEEGES
ncbi:MAG: extracellular solute-binding protein [Lachnospiraceae bacterium]|nr:extracellular solute-binding protein [Lachnospiraceae bacterium]